mmetsp:Transcript_41730/g.104286  ORF Transcript_41730/g.104286 Transcript_41730/m.104286 type:complete len:186 (+) Transcript_41730:210-767(+)|eukprot:CAMPEP_0173422418 /NCGR_PEP_ID=MMETSP1357-20121228/3136_1 /TAXON_ID=77926 /ORGANISM="Hemiselmis rufescens, Strain PCC563" /LENGTH=185 /DNA_ID=CAMNT_0014385445 /DNA_START=210 /DNA_END=767 /DNA_ORIENTATION=+
MAHKPRPRKAASVDDILSATANAGPAQSLLSKPPPQHPARRLGAPAPQARVPPAAASRGPPKGRPRPGKQVHGEVSDPVMQAELSAMQSVNKRDDNWHVFGVQGNRELDNTLLALPDDMPVAWARQQANAVVPGGAPPQESEEERQARLIREIQAIDGAIGASPRAHLQQHLRQQALETECSRST